MTPEIKNITLQRMEPLKLILILVCLTATDCKSQTLKVAYLDIFMNLSNCEM